MTSTIPWRLGEAIHEAVALQRVWLARERAAMPPGQPEPCGASDAYVTFAMAVIAARRPARATHGQQMTIAARIARKRMERTVTP